MKSLIFFQTFLNSIVKLKIDSENILAGKENSCSFNWTDLLTVHALVFVLCQRIRAGGVVIGWNTLGETEINDTFLFQQLGFQLFLDMG